MEEVSSSLTDVLVRLSHKDILLISNALNEVCYGIDIPEFETRLGVDKKYASDTLDKLNVLYDKMATRLE